MKKSDNKFSGRFNDLVDIANCDLTEYSLNDLEKMLEEANNAYNDYHNLELIVKRNCNSVYGSSASVYYSLTDFDLAEDITTTGRNYCCIVDVAINKFFQFWANDKNNLNIIKEFYPETTELLNYSEYEPNTINDLCVYGDTDSRYVRFDLIYKLIVGVSFPENTPEGNKKLADFTVFMSDKFINKIIKDTIDAECEYRNANKGYLKMAHEVTSRRSIYQAPKKYIMSLIWKDGKLLKDQKLKVTGVELKKGETNKRIKNILTVLVNKFIINNYSENQMRNECLKLMKHIKTLKDKTFIYRITSVSGLNDIVQDPITKKYYSASNKKHIQMQIALSWYNFIEENNLHDKYKPPFERQKMQYYYHAKGVIGIPDDVDIKSVENLPEPDYNKMIGQILLKPILKYINKGNKFDDKDIENFILGIKTLR